MRKAIPDDATNVFSLTRGNANSAPILPAAERDPRPGRPSPPSAPQPVSPKKKTNFYLDTELMEGVRDAVAFFGATLSDFGEEALRFYLEHLKEQHNEGEPFPKRTKKRLPPGRRPA